MMPYSPWTTSAIAIATPPSPPRLGRSTAAGSLLLWTHKLNQIEFHDAFTPAGAVTGTAGLAAVTVGAGVQFQALYPAANNRRFPGDPYDRQSIVMGGTCDSVRRQLVQTLVFFALSFGSIRACAAHACAAAAAAAAAAAVAAACMRVRVRARV